MKKSNLTLGEGFLGIKAEKAYQEGKTQMVFDWDKAAELIKTHLDKKDLNCEAGLQGDWSYTGGCIFENNKPTSEGYTYLSSNWAVPTLIISFDGEEQFELECYTTDETTRFDSDSKWDDISLKLLGIKETV
jgi:hypothetical protein